MKQGAEEPLELLTVEKPIKHSYWNFPDVKRYTTLPDGTKHGRYIKEGKTKYSTDEDIVLYEERFYSHGKLHGKHSLWMMHQGQVYDYLQINNYDNGLLHGEQIYYELNMWTVRRKEYYDHDKVVRVYMLEKYTRGYKANYNAEGLKHGRCRTYYHTHHIDTSTLKTDGEWRNGRRIGIHREYAQGAEYKHTGELLHEIDYGAAGDDDYARDGEGYRPNEYRRADRYKLKK
jgi:hypothetical protein